MASDNSNETCWHLTDVVAQLIYFSLTVLLFTTILLPLSSFDVAYHQIAFEQRKSTGTVYTGEEYFGGRHLIGPDFKFNAFQADAHTIEFTLQALDNATSDKLNIKIQASLQDVLGEEGLEHLHKRFNRGYNPTVKNTAKTARKKDVTTEQEQALFQSVQRALGGICCRKDYSKYQCMNYKSCGKCIGDVRYFQMHDVNITEELKGRWLEQVVEREDKEKAEFIQKEQIARTKTEQKNQDAAANVAIITTAADAKSFQFVEDARNKVLQLLYTSLNFTNEQNKASFNYPRTFPKPKNIRLHVNFHQPIRIVKLY